MARFYASFRIDVMLNGTAVWAQLNDVLWESGIRATRGILGNSPLDRVADPGTLEFALRNDKYNSGRTRGWYSPNHPSARAGWIEGIPIRLIGTYRGTDYPLWRGKIRTIDPTPGDEPQRANVVAYDCFADFVETTVREITPQANKTEVQLLQAIIAALPAANQPVATSYDSALDNYPYSLDDIGGGVAAAGPLQDVTTSAFGTLFVKGDGTLRYKNRHSEATSTSSLTLVDSDLLFRGPGFRGPSSRANLFDWIRVTIHPKTIVPSTVLFSNLSTTELQPGASLELWDSYSDPNSRDRLIGGINFTALAPTTDYTANTLADGSGIDRTSSLSIALTAFAAAAKSVVSNIGTDTFFITKRQLRGDGIFDNSPVTVESTSTGTRPFDIDLKYQDDAPIAQDFADYVRAQYSNRMRQGDELVWDPQRSNTSMLAALTLEIGDVVTASERQTGVNAVQFLARGITYEIEPGPLGFNLTMRYRIVPAFSSSIFQFDDATFGVFDSAVAKLGYA